MTVTEEEVEVDEEMRRLSSSFSLVSSSREREKERAV
jgi:hypothetical protein